jgi:hypothetical protein
MVECFAIVRITLERLEQLEKENLELKQDIVSFEDYSYDLDCEKEQLEKENQELKDKNTKMFVELSNTITAINKFLNYLDKDKTKTIAKYSIKETFFKIIDKVVEE